MKLNTLICTLFLVLCLITRTQLNAQTKYCVYADLFQNNISDDLIIRSAVLANYPIGKFRAGAGVQVDLNGMSKNILSGYSLKLSKELRIKKLPIEVESFYLLTPYSNVLRESNWGFLTNLKTNHFAMSVGTNFRTYALTQSEIRKQNAQSNTKIHEVWNIMYSFSYTLKQSQNDWNFTFTVNNFDNFQIQEETNPVLKVGFSQELNSHVNLFLESAMKSAGMMNTYVNWFEFNLRAGISWKI